MGAPEVGRKPKGVFSKQEVKEARAQVETAVAGLCLLALRPRYHREGAQAGRLAQGFWGTLKVLLLSVAPFWLRLELVEDSLESPGSQQLARAQGPRSPEHFLQHGWPSGGGGEEHEVLGTGRLKSTGTGDSRWCENSPLSFTVEPALGPPRPGPSRARC